MILLLKPQKWERGSQTICAGLDCESAWNITFHEHTFRKYFRQKHNFGSNQASLKSVLKPENKVYYVADSSFYLDSNIKNILDACWINHIPAAINEAKELLTANLNMKMLENDQR